MIGEKIRELRQKKDMTLSKLAAKAGVSKTYLSNIERSNQKNPSVDFVIRISEALEISVVDLLEIHTKEIEKNNIKSWGLDEELFELVKELMELGVSKEQLKEYLEFQRWRREQDKFFSTATE